MESADTASLVQPAVMNSVSSAEAKQHTKTERVTKIKLNKNSEAHSCIVQKVQDKSTKRRAQGTATDTIAMQQGDRSKRTGQRYSSKA